MSTFEEIQPQDLISIYQRAHEELADLQSQAPPITDNGQDAATHRAAVERHKTLIRQLRLAMRERP
jgi:hypothetical protein